MDDMRRVRVQLSSKMDYSSNMQSSSHQPLRQGIFDLIQKVRSSVKGGEPITSNLPSENIAMGIGSKRLAGTGRTAGILLKKQQKQGIVPLNSSSSLSAASASGGGIIRRSGGGGGDGNNNSDELTFLKNAIGQEIAFELEKGGGARANLLATRGRIRNKLIDAAAMKVGVDIGLVARVIIEERERYLQRRREEKEREKEEGGKRKKQQSGGDELHFLQDNIGVLSTELTRDEMMKKKSKKKMKRVSDNAHDSKRGDKDGTASDTDDETISKKLYYISDETDELWNLPEDDRRAAFQAQYKAEVERQKKLLGISSLDDVRMFVPYHSRLNGGCDETNDDEELENIAWEDG